MHPTGNAFTKEGQLPKLKLGNNTYLPQIDGHLKGSYKPATTVMGLNSGTKYNGGMPMLKELISEKRGHLSSMQTHMNQSTNVSPDTMRDYDNNYNHSSIQIGGGSFKTKNSNLDIHSRRNASVKNSVSYMYGGSDMNQPDSIYQGLWKDLREFRKIKIQTNDIQSERQLRYAKERKKERTQMLMEQHYKQMMVTLTRKISKEDAMYNTQSMNETVVESTMSKKTRNEKNKTMQEVKLGMSELSNKEGLPTTTQAVTPLGIHTRSTNPENENPFTESKEIKFMEEPKKRTKRNNKNTSNRSSPV